MDQGDSFSRLEFSLEHLSEEVDPCAVLPLRALYSDPMCHNPVPRDAPVYEPHQSDVNPTLDVALCPRLGLLIICYEASDYTFQGIRRLHFQ